MIYTKEAEIFKALSHPTRILILHSIKENRLSVSELAGLARVDISTISKHLDLLKRYRLVVSEKVGNAVFYRVNIPCIFNFLECARLLTIDDGVCSSSCFCKGN